MLRGALKSKKGRNKAIYFQPLTQLQIEEQFKPTRQLQYIKEVKPNYVYKTVHTAIYKTTMVLFLSEVLNSALREEEQNEPLYNYLETSLQYLDNEDESSNFHLLFLLKLTRYLGFQPEGTNSDLPFFNLRSGRFEALEEDIYSISNENLTLLKRLLGINFDDIQSIRITAKQRRDFLNMLLHYFELHLDGFKKPKSLQVLNDVFH
jgi:DNA repair protein RecO (recombination protein O)